MLENRLNPFLWVFFAGLIVVGAYVALSACDLGFRPLFGAASCPVPTLNAALESERAKEELLRSQIQAEQIKLALLPACQKPLPPHEVTPVPIKVPDPTPKPQPKPQQVLEVPKKIEELKGCWQSANGDIDLTTDDAEQKPVGKVRICYCFRGNGRGRVQLRYTDGDVCRADLIARISPDQVLIHHDQVACRRHPYYVASDIKCGNGSDDRTNCEIQNLGKVGAKSTEQFIKVGNEYCGWDG